MIRSILRSIAGLALLLALAGGVGIGTYELAADRREPPVSASAAVHAEIDDVGSAAELLVYCYRLREIPGVATVSVRAYLPASKRATIAVFYNPSITSPVMIRRFLRIRAILWEPRYSV